jgi:methylthioribose-1-phosphate isomerase
MNVKGKPYTTIWLSSPGRVSVIDQRRLPHEFVIAELTSCSDAALAIRDMTVRGAGLIGVTAAWGMYLAAFRAGGPGFTDELRETALTLKKTRPTAKNLEWAVDRMLNAILASDRGIKAAESEAASIAAEDASFCRRIGEHGLPLIRAIAERKGGKPVNILTHCNAGWLAFTDYGSATAPIYAAFDAGIPLHVWVDETRPRNQGANLTAWELGMHGVPYHLIVDNAGGHLMQRGLVDLVITGADRVTRTGDAANKIGTYLKALAARDNGIPFYAALPSSTFDWEIEDGVRDIPIEERDADEVRYVGGLAGSAAGRVLICPGDAPVSNYGFDVTPSRLITGLLTERGLCPATASGIESLYPEKFCGSGGLV